MRQLYWPTPQIGLPVFGSFLSGYCCVAHSPFSPKDITKLIDIGIIGDNLYQIITTIFVIPYQLSNIGAEAKHHTMGLSLTRYVKLWVVHAPGMPGTFSPLPRVSDPDIKLGTCMTHVSWCTPGSLASSFLWSRWRRKRSRHSRRMHYPQCHVYGERPMQWTQRNCYKGHPPQLTA